MTNGPNSHQMYCIEKCIICDKFEGNIINEDLFKKFKQKVQKFKKLDGFKLKICPCYIK